jgi:hypothetical protein
LKILPYLTFNLYLLRVGYTSEGGKMKNKNKKGKIYDPHINDCETVNQRIPKEMDQFDYSSKE